MPSFTTIRNATETVRRKLGTSRSDASGSTQSSTSSTSSSSFSSSDSTRRVQVSISEPFAPNQTSQAQPIGRLSAIGIKYFPTRRRTRAQKHLIAWHKAGRDTSAQIPSTPSEIDDRTDKRRNNWSNMNRLLEGQMFRECGHTRWRHMSAVDDTESVVMDCSIDDVMKLHDPDERRPRVPACLQPVFDATPKCARNGSAHPSHIP